MKFPRTVFCLAVLFALPSAYAAPKSTKESGDDPLVARGLATALHGPNKLAVGQMYPFLIEAIGFPEASRGVPLPGATVEVGWTAAAGEVEEPSKTVSGVTDAEGRFRGELLLADGPEQVELLVRVTKGGQTRTEVTTVHRLPSQTLTVRGGRREVRPGSSASAYIRSDETSGTLNKNLVVAFRRSGGSSVEIASTSVTLNAHNAAWVAFDVPPSAEPGTVYSISANCIDAPKGHPTSSQCKGGEASFVVVADAPAEPKVSLGWEHPELAPGGRTEAHLAFNDAQGAPVAGVPVKALLLARAEPPSEREWEKALTGATAADGVYRFPFLAPTLVPPSGVTYTLFAKASVSGEPRLFSAPLKVIDPPVRVDIVPEGGELVPGVEQDLYVHVARNGLPVVGAFSLSGDTRAPSARTFTTNADGLATVRVTPAIGAGAPHAGSACQASFGATFVVRAEGAGLRGADHTDAVYTCVPVVERRGGISEPEEKPILLDLESPVVVAGTPFHGRIRGSSGTFRVTAASMDGASTAAPSVPFAADGSFTFPTANLRGPLALFVDPLEAGPREKGGHTPAHPLRGAARHVLVIPAKAPRLTVEHVEGRLVPGGTARITVRVTDDAGHPVSGEVTGLVARREQLPPERAWAFDARRSLCPAPIRALAASTAENASAGARSACDRFLGAGAADASLQKMYLADIVSPASPLRDPARTATKDLRETFKQTLSALHKAVLEASSSKEALRGVRRGSGVAAEFHPELLVSIDESSVGKTPGGLAVRLADLKSVDPQVTFGIVARRVTRLKLLRALMTIREARASMDRDEPVFKDPNVFLRRLLRDGTLDEGAILDPWGGSFAFKRAANPAFPFLTVRPGWVLASPGPDGALGTADDIDNPFGRVVREGTPFAKAVDEQSVVDAGWDVEVSEATIAKWNQTISEATDGSSEGMGLTGSGGGGGGSGTGFGRGGIRVREVADRGFVPPVSLDADGRGVVEVAIGNEEATYRAMLVATDAKGDTAADTVDLPTSLTTSVRAQLPPRLTVADTFELPVLVRNRTARDEEFSWEATFDGSVSPGAALRAGSLLVPAGGEAVAYVPTVAAKAGAGAVTVRLRRNGVDVDAFSTPTTVDAAMSFDTTITTFIATSDKKGDATRLELPRAENPIALKVTVNAGGEEILRRALQSVDPSTLSDEDASQALALLAEVKLARTAQGESVTSELLVDVQRRFAAVAGAAPSAAEHGAHFRRAWARAVMGWDKTPAAFRLEESDRSAAARLVEFEPDHASPAWDQFVSALTTNLQDMPPHEFGHDTPDLLGLSRSVLAFTKRDHRRPVAEVLAKRLREAAGVTADGRLTLGGLGGPRSDAKRPDRTLVYSALIAISPPDEAILREKLLTEQAIDGSFGSMEATRAALRALRYGAGQARSGATALGGAPKYSGSVVALTDENGAPADSKAGTLPVTARAVRVVLSKGAEPTLVRVERVIGRSWASPPPSASEGVTLSWFGDSGGDSDALLGAAAAGPMRGATGRLLVSLPNADDARTLRFVLPPGALLAGKVEGVSTYGNLMVIAAKAYQPATVLTIPLQFGLAGTFRLPEGRVTFASGRTQSQTVPSSVVTIAAHR